MVLNRRRTGSVKVDQNCNLFTIVTNIWHRRISLNNQLIRGCLSTRITLIHSFFTMHNTEIKYMSVYSLYTQHSLTKSALGNYCTITNNNTMASGAHAARRSRGHCKPGSLINTACLCRQICIIRILYI